MRIVRILIVLSMPVILLSCGVKKAGVMEKKDEIAYTDRVLEISENIQNDAQPSSEDLPLEEEVARPMLRIETARAFLGTPYRYGGNNDLGMDCSGLIQTAFLDDQIRLPRISRDIARVGIEINLDEVSSGDLLFFTTSSSHNTINHVGLITEVTGNNVFFIHSTTSRGVIISSLEERFWKNSLAMARRIE